VSAWVWRTWALVVVCFTTFGGFIALTAWLPTCWSEFYGPPVVMAGLPQEAPEGESKLRVTETP